jgi:hypothetical protein
VSGFDEQTPPSGEQLHVPRASWLPVLLAVGLTLALVGVTVSIVFTIIGLLIAIPVLVRWIHSAREEMGELPPGH